MAEQTDSLDAMLADVVSGKGSGPQFYDALLKGTLFVVVENGESDAAPGKAVFAHRIQGDRKIIDVYTSPAQMLNAPEAKIGRTLQMTGRELLALIAQTGCDVGVNAHSDHGGLLTAQKIADLLKT